MRRITLAVGVIVVGMGILMVGLASASSDITAPTRVHFTVRAHQIRIVDAGKHGLRLGSQYVFSDNLYSSRRKVGRMGGSYEVVRRRPVEYNLLASITTRGGKVTVQGLVRRANLAEGDTYRLAVTGGTGIYRNARGYAEVEVETVSVSSLTLNLIP